MEGRGVMPEMAEGPLFIVSMWRGGSSLLHLLLNKHPKVALMFEADCWLLRPLFLKPDFLNNWPERWEFWNQMFSRHGLNPCDFAGVRPDFKSVFEAVHRAYAWRKGASIWGDKSPNYHDQLLRMAKVFPAARFIVVERDPIDTMGATLRAAAAGSRYFRKPGMIDRALLGYRVFTLQCEKLAASGAAVHQLHYEDLVSDTATIMKRVCAFLEIPYHDSLSTLAEADRSAVYAGRHHHLLRGDAVEAGPRPNALDPLLRRKAEGYVRLWRESDANGLDAASPREKSFTSARLRFDQIRYRFYRGLDALVRLAFCFLPIPFLRLYRKTRLVNEPCKLSQNSAEVSVKEQLCMTTKAIRPN
jgi:hypothetical protein